MKCKHRKGLSERAYDEQFKLMNNSGSSSDFLLTSEKNSDVRRGWVDRKE